MSTNVRLSCQIKVVGLLTAVASVGYYLNIMMTQLTALAILLFLVAIFVSHITIICTTGSTSRARRLYKSVVRHRGNETRELYMLVGYMTFATNISMTSIVFAISHIVLMNHFVLLDQAFSCLLLGLVAVNVYLFRLSIADKLDCLIEESCA